MEKKFFVITHEIIDGAFIIESEYYDDTIVVGTVCCESEEKGPVRFYKLESKWKEFNTKAEADGFLKKLQLFLDDFTELKTTANKMMRSAERVKENMLKEFFNHD